MRDDVTGLCGTVEESSDFHGTKISSLHHHHFELTTTFDRRFISIETRFDDHETHLRHDMHALSLRLDCHDERFTQFMESHTRDHREMMTYLYSFPPPTPYAIVFLVLMHPPCSFLMLSKGGDILYLGALGI